MFKIITNMVLLSISLCSTIPSNDINDDVLFINDNGVEVNKTMYDKLTSIGFSLEEIYDLDLGKFNYFSSVDVENTKTFESNSYFNNDTTVNNNIEGITSIVSYESNEEKKYVSLDDSKKMITYVSKIKSNDEYLIYVKQNVTWNKEPNDRMHDLITLNYTNNLRIDEKDNYPNVEVTFRYKEVKYKKTGWKHKNPKYTEKTFNINHKVELNGKNQDKYNHSVGNYIGFEVDLPSDSYLNGSSSRYYLIEKHTYTNFYITMETVLKTNHKNMTGTEIQTRYAHQSVDKEINWGEVTFTTTPPFITYNYTGFLWIQHNSFDSGLYNSISIDF